MNRIRMFHSDTLSCEPILRRVENGELLCISQCGDVAEPAPLNRVYAFHSADNGETWSKPQSVWPEDGRAVYLTEVTVHGDEITVYLTLHNGDFLNWVCRIVRSHNNGYTWTEAGPPPVYSTFTFFRGEISLADRTRLLAYQHYAISDEENKLLVQKGLRWIDSQCTAAENGVLRSTDQGKTWEHCTGPLIAMKGDTNRNWVWSEPTLAEVEPGHIVMLLRVCRSGKLWQSHSYDGGKTWSGAEETTIPNPNNKPKLIPMPNGRIALIHTPNATPGMKNRNPLSVWISDDGMQTWPYQHVVTDFPGMFCYPDGFFEDGHILFSIEYNRHDLLFVDHEVED